MIRQHLISNPLVKGEKIAIVTHSKFISALTASGVKGQGDDCELAGGTYVENCETIAWTDYWN